MLHFLLPQAGKTLSARRWHAAFSKDGRLNIEEVLRRIQRGVTFIVYLYTVSMTESVNMSNNYLYSGLCCSVVFVCVYVFVFSMFVGLPLL